MTETKISEDPDLTPKEKETIIRFANDEDRLHIHSEQAAVIRWLLAHPEYREDRRRVTNGQQHATTGTLPVGALSLKGQSRKSSRPSDVTGVLPDE